jgi:dolichol-phosphate mannosyltransferase
MLSIVVPTYCEVDNVALLTQRIFETVREAGISCELILVDDNSRDGSVEAIEKLQANYPVRMIVREDERGLSTAVLRGFEDAKGEIFLVMDADLSHPPEKILDLHAAVKNGEADFVFGSRYVSGGETKDWPFLRKLNSRVATLLARPLTSATDPPLSPLGYKIGLELLIKGRCRKLRDTPIVFADRHAGKSKLTFRQQLLYLIHLKRLYFFKFPLWSALVFYALPLLLVGWIVWMLAT